MATRNTSRLANIRAMQVELAEQKRRRGATFRAIAAAVGVTKSTVHRWTQHIEFAQPEARCCAEIVPASDGRGYLITHRTEHPPTPDQHKRGGRRKRPQHIKDDARMTMLQEDLNAAMRQR